MKGGSRPSAANETAPWKYVVGADGSSIARRATPLRRPSSSSSSKKKTTTSTTTGRNNRRPLMRRRSTSLTTEQAPRPGLGFPLALDPPRIERRPKTNKKKTNERRRSLSGTLHGRRVPDLDLNTSDGHDFVRRRPLSRGTNASGTEDAFPAFPLAGLVGDLCWLAAFEMALRLLIFT